MIRFARTRRRLRRALRPYVPRRLVYRAGLRGESEWWERYLASGGGEWRTEFRSRLDPTTPLGEPLVGERLGRFAGGVVRILDVGAGPLTALGKTHPEVRLEITACDPLAGEYSRMLAAAGVEPPVATLPCAGEHVARRFGHERFDVAYARNAVDHSEDPMAVIRSMVTAVRPGGFVALRHYRCEAENVGYVDLHNWNFDVADGRLRLWGPYGDFDVQAELAGTAEVEAWIEAGPRPWVCAVLERRGRSVPA